MKIKRILGLEVAILAGAALLGAPAAYAATETSNMSVSATVTNVCSLTTEAMAFGTIDTNNGASVQDDAQADVTLTCSGGPTSSSVAVGGGLYYSSGRRMKDGSTNYVNYALYSDSGRTTGIALDGVIGGLTDIESSPTTGTIYGRVPAQSLTAGVYADTVTLTLTYEP